MDEEARIRAVLEHIGRGRGLGDFPATKTERLALAATASRRRLIEWDRARGRYGLTSAGRRQLAVRARFAVRPRLVGQAIAITLAAVALGLWFSAGASHLLVGARTPPKALDLPLAAPTHTAVAAVAPPAEPTPVAATPADVAEPPSTEPAPATAPAKVAVPANVVVPLDKSKSSAKSKRKLAKSHHKARYASRHKRHDPTLAYQPRYFAYPNQGNWSFFR
jgi:hypothetical protein